MYSVEIVPQLDDGIAADSPVLAEVVFAHTATYPDEAPLVKARSVRGLADSEVAALQSLIDSQVEENMGMPMVYTLVTAAQEWITEKAAEQAKPVHDPAAERRRLEEEEEARIAALRAHGTPVTPETFAEWRVKFEAEMALARTALADVAGPVVAGPAAAPGKLTGRQYFQQQEAQHLEIEEPELSSDEEDGEDARSQWSGEGEPAYHAPGHEGEGDEFDVTESDEDDMLDEILATRAA